MRGGVVSAEDGHDFYPLTQAEREEFIDAFPLYCVLHGAYCDSTGVFVRFAGSYRSRTGQPITALSPLPPMGFLESSS